MSKRQGQNSDAKLRKLEVIDGAINFVCLRDKCPSSCCGPFGGVQRGIDSVEGREFSEIVLTPEDSRLLLSSGLAHLIESVGEHKYRMKLHEDGTCVAFQNGQCSINNYKPTVCRAFPFYIDMFVGLCGVTDCAGFGSGWTKLEDLSDEIEAAKSMYLHWINEVQPGRVQSAKGTNESLVTIQRRPSLKEL